MDIDIEFIHKLIFLVGQYQADIKDDLRRLELGMSDYPILISLSNRHPAALSQTELARTLRRDPALITRSVHKLAGLGLLSIAPDAANASRNLISITDEGLERSRAVKEIIAAWQADTLGRLAPDEALQLAATVDALYRSVVLGAG